MCCISMVESWWVTEELIQPNSTLNLIRVTESQFADDTALYATFIELHLSQWQLRGSEKVYGYRE